MPERDSDNVHELIQRYLDGALSADELAELNAALAHDASARSAFIRSSYQARLIAENLAAEVGGATPMTAQAEHAATALRWAGWAWWRLAAAAIIVVAVGLGMWIGLMADRDGGVNGDGARPRPMESLGSVVSARGVTWRGEPTFPGEALSEQRVSIASGTLELLLGAGQEVVLSGETELTILDPSRVHLARGALDVRSRPGFTVTLPGGGRVVDRGTAFAVRVTASGAWAVLVTDGSVDVYASEAATTAPLRVAAGQTVAMTAAGEAVGSTQEPADVESDTSPGGEAYAIAVASGRPLAYWRFDDVSDARAANAMGPMHAAQLSGVSIDGGGNPSVLFSGDAEDQVDLSTLGELLDGQAYTVELWMRPSRWHTGSLVTMGTGVYLGVTGEASSVAPGHRVRFVHRAMGATRGGVDLYGDYEPGRWHHVAAVRESGSVTLYVDGVRVDSRAFSAVWDSRPPYVLAGRLRPIGDADPDPRVFDGRLDEIAIYDRALDEREVRTHYLMGVPAPLVLDDERNRDSNHEEPQGERHED